jgi:hypothetical protein
MAGPFALVSPPTWPFWARVGSAIVQGARGLMTQAPAAGMAGAVVGGGKLAIDAMPNAETGAQARDAAGTSTCMSEDCKRERRKNCAHLANGVPGSPYRGGAHGSTKLPWGDGLESHHTPARAISPLPTDAGPAIQMEPGDHTLTASHPNQPGADAYRLEQALAIAEGRFMDAVSMDIADVSRKFPGKYDDALDQMQRYAQCLDDNKAW